MREDTQQQTRDFVSRQVFENQTLLVEALFVQDIFSWEDIINAYENSDEDDAYSDIEDQEPKEIFEWWLISDNMGRLLKQQGEAILENDYGLWWGRSCCGQAIYLDGVITDIVSQIKHVA